MSDGRLPPPFMLESTRVMGTHVAERVALRVEALPEKPPAPDIARSQTGVTAFIGRALKGPVNRPVPITSFGEFERQFGGLWQPSTLSYAVEQYFDNGGRRAIVVRVANGARPPTLALAANGAQLRLVGVNPGSREYLRAAVDYDGIAAGESDRFNLVVQRVRIPGSELIEEQEIHRRVCAEPGSGRFVGDVLLGSHLARALDTPPSARPDPTAGLCGPPAGYIQSNPDGDDGAALSDYDVIGSAAAGSGLFALRTDARFDLLCIPPLGREQDVGMSAMLVAERFCRERHAMLVVDPPVNWTSPVIALEELRAWPFRSENAVMFFPRVLAFDRLRNRAETFGSSAAGAGLIARMDETCPIWAPAESEDVILRPGLKAAVPVSDPERARLRQAGINTLQSVRSGTRVRASPCTLAAGSSGASDWQYLSARRLALFIVASIERGTSWLTDALHDPESSARAQAQVERFLASLARDGAFAGSEPEDSYFAICDERLNPPQASAEGKIHLLFGFATTKPGEFHAWLTTHQAAGSSSRPTAVNRLATSQRRLESEIETLILRS